MAYQTPKTNWTPVDGVQDLDLNRIEGNIDDLHSNSVPYSGATQDVDLAGKVLKNMQAINLQDAANDGILWKWLEGNLAGRNGNAELRSYNIADSSLKATGISMTPNGILSLLAQSYVDTNKATAQSIATSTAAKATGFANTTDRQGESVSDSITVAESGIYAIYANGAWASANIPRAYVNTYKNNANAGTVVETNSGGIAQAVTFSGTQFLALTAGDVLTFYVYQNSGAVVNLNNLRIRLAKLY